MIQTRPAFTELTNICLNIIQIYSLPRTGHYHTSDYELFCSFDTRANIDNLLTTRIAAPSDSSTVTLLSAV
ncbi:hypothetical protein E2C01_096254 [Portunus trituberculatus]|uniref:Uncharacterized protein n=1 Tax=Portunus trituberculatus TaxID=210409 RepID=A0A5B7K633_PORTR|nr:hypothetical protein [Portunus trituberculatus]